MHWIALLACTGQTTTDTVGDTVDSGSIELPQGTLSATPSEHMVTAVTLTAELDRDWPLELTCVGPQQGDVPEKHHWTAGAAGTTHTAAIRGLLAETTYVCTAVGTEISVEFTTGALPAGMLTHTLRVDTWLPDADVGWTLIAPFLFESSSEQHDIFYVVVDMAGQVRWYVASEGGDGVVTFDYNADTQRFWAGGGLKRRLPGTAYDLSGEMTTQLSSDANHDVDWFEDSAWTLQENESDAFCVEERSWADDQVLWTLCGNEIGQPTLKLNSLDVRREQGEIVIYGGSASSHRIIKIHKERRELLWQFTDHGDFEGVTVFSDTHDVNGLDCDGFDACLLYYDNGTEETGSAARLWGLDEAGLVATELFAWSEAGWYEPSMGSVQLLDSGSVFVSRSHVEVVVPGGPETSVVEVSPSGEVLWQLSLGPVEHSTYRARRVDPCLLFNHAGYCPQD